MLVDNSIAVIRGVLFSFLLVPSLFAEGISPKPDIQLIMVGETFAAVDNWELLSEEVLVQSKPTLPLSVLSHHSFFDALDQEIIDPFRSAENFDNLLTRLADFLDYNVGLFGEYDDNVFLTPDGKVSDNKVVLNQSLQIRYPIDKFYFELLYAVNLDFFAKLDELVASQRVDFGLSYYPFEKLSLGISNQFSKVGDSRIATNVGDQTLTLGQVTNTIRSEFEYELWENGFFEFFWKYDYIHFSSDEIRQFINRDVHTLNARLRHRLIPTISNYLGYQFRDSAFRRFEGKDAEIHTLFYGVDYEVPGWLTFFGELGYESKRFKNTGGQVIIPDLGLILPFAERRSRDNNLNFLVGIKSNLSRFNAISLTYNSRLVDASRPEFTQYLGKTFALNSRYFIDNKTILFSSLFLEYQEFDSADVFDVLFAGGNADTMVYATGFTLRRIITDSVFFDIGYTYTDRDTDFTNESSNNSRFRFGARATF